MIDKKAIKMNWSIVTLGKTHTINSSKLITGLSDDVRIHA